MWKEGERREREREEKFWSPLELEMFSHHCLYWAIKGSEEEGQGGKVPPWRDNTRV